MDKLGQREEFEGFRELLPEGLSDKLARFEDRQWFPERWDEIENIRQSMVKQASNEELWDRFEEHFETYYDKLDWLQQNAIDSGRYARPLKLSKELTDHLVRFSLDETFRFLELYRKVPEKAIDGRVLDAFEIYPDFHALQNLLFSTLYYNQPHLYLSTQIALHDPENLANALIVGKRAGIEYVHAIVRHPQAKLLRDQRTLKGIRNSPFPPGFVHLAENVGLADCIMEMTNDIIGDLKAINGVLCVYPFSVDSSTLTRHEYYFVGGCGGGKRREELVSRIEHDDRESTITLFPGRKAFKDLQDQYYFSSFLPGCVGYLKFTDCGDGLLVSKNKTTYRAPTVLDRMSSPIQRTRDFPDELELSDDYIERFSLIPQILWWAAHEYARNQGKEWIAICDSSFHMERSRETLPARYRKFLKSIQISKTNKFRVQDWEYVHDNAVPTVLSQEEADRHYDNLVEDKSHPGECSFGTKKVRAWQVPIMQNTPLTEYLEERTTEQILFQ